MVQLTKSGVVVSASRTDVERLRAQFEADQCIQLRRLVEPELLSVVQRQVDHAVFDELIHPDIGVELCMPNNATMSLLYFLTNDPRLFQLVQQITGCGRIGCFMGRVYRMVPQSRHYDSWHDDAVEHRIIAMSVNLSQEIYDGGVLRLREASSKRILCETANTGPGDAVLFRIANDLEHRLTPLEGTVPKTAFAGWFHSEPEFLSLLTRAHGADAER